MEYKTIADVSKPVSRMVFGTAIPPIIRGENARRLLDAVYAAGINTFDTARAYGLAEKSLGSWIAAKGIRDKVVILSKGAHPLEGSTEPRVTPEAIREDVEKSLEMLQTDFIDIYLLHRDNPKVPAGPLVETLNELRERGKIGIFGGSNWSYQRIDEANEYAYSHDMFGFEASSPAMSLAVQKEDPFGGGCIDLSGRAHETERNWYLGKGIEVFAYAGLGRGFLSGKFRSDEEKKARKVLDEFGRKGYCSSENFERLRRAEVMAAKKRASVPQIALAWVLRQPIAPMVICSTSTPKRVSSNLQAFDIELTAEDIRWLSEG